MSIRNGVLQDNEKKGACLNKLFKKEKAISGVQVLHKFIHKFLTLKSVKNI